MYLLDFAKNLERDIVDFFINAKFFIINLVTDFYDGLVDMFGEMPTNIILITLIAVIVMYILLKIINR